MATIKKPKAEELSKLRSQVETEYQSAFETVIKKRQKFRDQDKWYNGTEDTDKIDLKTVFYVVNAMMALDYSDKVSIKWKARHFADSDQAENLNKMAEFDKDEMNLDVLNYEVRLNKYLRGVGIRAMTSWDSKTNKPIFRAIDTRQWIPDPMGWFDPNEFRFHGFEFEIPYSELKEEEGYFDTDKIAFTEDSENIITRNYAQRTAGLNPTPGLNIKGNEMVNVYQHFNRIVTEDGIKTILSSWVNNRTVCIRYQELEAEASEAFAPFPVILNYFCPRKYDPYGTSVVDLIQDKHRYKNLITNLMFIREKDNALGDDVIYDMNVVQNKADLITPALGARRFIGADGSMWPVTNAFAVVPKNGTPASNMQFLDLMDQAIQTASSVDARQIGLVGTQNITLGEAQQIQANNNLISSFRSKIDAVGEKYFWKTWYRAYKINFRASQKKIIRITKPFGDINIEFKKKQFITKEDPEVKVISQAEKQAEDEKGRAYLAPLLMSTMNNPNISSISKTMAMRRLFEMNGMEKEEAEVYAPPSPEELDAKQKLILINNNDPLGAKIDNMQVDHWTYIVIFRSAIDNPVKEMAIQARIEAMIQMGQNLPQAPTNEQAGNNSMATSQLLNSTQQSQQPKPQSRDVAAK